MMDSISRYQQKMQYFQWTDYVGDERQNFSGQDIQEIEKEIGCKLPDDYADFLIHYGGSFIYSAMYPFPSPFFNGVQGGVERFYSIPMVGREFRVSSGLHALMLSDREEELVPANLLPISDGLGQNQICISLYGADQGHVYWLFGEEGEMIEDGEERGYSNLYFIANSFDEFINSFTIVEDETDYYPTNSKVRPLDDIDVELKTHFNVAYPTSLYQTKIQKLAFIDLTGEARATFSHQDIAAIEAILGYSLPENYIDFLIHFGGMGTCAKFDLKYPEDSEIMMRPSIIFGIQVPGHPQYELAHNINCFKQRNLHNLLPIAKGAYGERICLVLDGADQGHIYFLETGELPFLSEIKVPGYNDNVYRITDSLDKFIDSLYIFYFAPREPNLS
jgi:hypothetical protein